MYITAYIAVMLQTYPRGSKAKFRLQQYLVNASTVSGMCLTASTVTVPSWILQIKPSPISLLQGSKKLRQNSRPDSGPRSIPRPRREARAGPARERDRLVTLLELRGLSTF